MKKLISILLLSLTVFSCEKEENTDINSLADNIVLKATILNGSKTEVQDGGTQVCWSPTDSISVFFKSSANKFISTNKDIATSADFVGTLNYIIGANEGSQANNNILAVAPYSSTASCGDGVISTTLSNNQIACDGTFTSGTYITAAKSNSFNLQFYGVCGGLRFSLSRSDIKQIVFEGNNNEILAGNVEISFQESGLPSIGNVSNGSTAITLSAPDNGTFKTGVWYFIVGVPTTMTKGFKMSFTTDKAVYVTSISNSVSFKRGIFGSVSEIDKNAEIQVPNLVDLGLSVKWRTCNVGASSEGDYGTHYAWGDSNVSFADWSGYKWCNGTYNTLTKYNNNSNYGAVDNKISLEESDDAATQNLGSEWRIPTVAEWQELCNNCNTSWTYRDGKYGYLLTSRINGKSIFFPAAGLYMGNTFSMAGLDGYYWASSIYESNPSCAWCLHFYNGNFSTSKDYTRCRRMSIRPVYAHDGKTNLSKEGTANCYVVSEAGEYKFNATVKGGSAESVGTPASSEVLWESFGTDVTPTIGDIVNNVTLKNGYVQFTATNKKGNAVIAVKDASDNILWSWHIWLTDTPVEQVYNNNAGTMMDRNLGATSATPGDVQSLGLLYQWGRKDPFLSGCQISYSSGENQQQAASTISWPSSVSSDSNNGKIAYAVSHPTTYITYNNYNWDWYYTGSSSTDNTRWQTLDKTKGIYDPCPQGWRVPDGGTSGVWPTAFGSSSYYSNGPWDNSNKGMNFGSGNGKSGSMQLGSTSTIWHPAAGTRNFDNDSLSSVGYNGYYHSCTTGGYAAYYMRFHYGDNANPSGVSPSKNGNRTQGYSVRCQKEKL